MRSEQETLSPGREHPLVSHTESQAKQDAGSPADHPRPAPLPWSVVALVLLLCAGWGGLAPALKIALREVPPIALAGWRFLLGVLAIAAWCRLRGISMRPGSGHGPTLTLASLLFVAQIALLNAGTRTTSGGHAILLLSTHPLFVALFAHWALAGDHLTVRKTAGLVVALAGTVAVLGERLSGGSLVGDALVVASAAVLGALVMVQKRALGRGYSVYELLMWQFAPGVVAFFLLSRWLEGPIAWPVSTTVWVSILYQGLAVSGFCFVAWNLLLERIPASRLTSFHLSTPIFGVLFSALILGEPLTLGVAAGTLLVGTGLALANRG